MNPSQQDPTPETPSSPAPMPTPPTDDTAPTPSPFDAAAQQPTTPPSAPLQPIGSAPADGPSMGAPQSKKGLKIGLIVGGAVLLIGIAVALFLLLGNKGSSLSEAVGSVTAAVTGESAVTDRPDGTLDLSGSVTTGTDASNQDVTAGLNQQVNLTDGGVLMVTKVERNFTGFVPKYFPVGAGEEVVAVTIVAGSRSVEGTGIKKSGLTLSAPSDSAISDSFASSLAKVDGLFDSANNLKQGEQVSGRLLFIVADGEKPLALNYATKYTNRTTGEVVNIKATINL